MIGVLGRAALPRRVGNTARTATTTTTTTTTHRATSRMAATHDTIVSAGRMETQQQAHGRFLSVSAGTAQAAAAKKKRGKKAAAAAAAADDDIVVELEIEEPSAHLCDGLPSTTVKTSKNELLEAFTTMTRLRKFEVASDSLYKQRLIRGFLHLYTGQEAVAVGAEAALARDDHVITAYRDHGWYLTRGGTPYAAFCELMGRRDGCSGGKGGSMHFYHADGNFYGGNGIVGAQASLGAGIAMGIKHQGSDRVCVSAYGDGAANQGQLFESYNMAKLWDLPVIWLCENNQYAMGTSVSCAAASTNFFRRGDFVPGMRCNGMDFLSVRETFKYATERAREGKGPFIVEAVTYRYAGHSMSDPGTTYRTREEVRVVRQTRDPITLIKGRLLDNNLATEQELKAIDKAVKKDIDAALAKAIECPEPDMSMLHEHVYTDPLNNPKLFADVPSV